jgi:hypothetical protein
LPLESRHTTSSAPLTTAPVEVLGSTTFESATGDQMG